uniref:ANK_REP_REGION domain-containing protein n=1 Tax=Anopheles atroparvus TaxID=41427 RepID=A0A182JIR6_ANOAO
MIVLVMGSQNLANLIRECIHTCKIAANAVMNGPCGKSEGPPSVGDDVDGIFLHIWKNPPRYDIYKMLVDKRKLLLYLGAVAGELKKILALPGTALPDGDMRTSSLSSSSEDRSGSTGSNSSTGVPCETSVPKHRPGKFHWTAERNRELMFCHYVVTGGHSDGSSDGQRYRTRLHELWTERQRTLGSSSSSSEDSAFDEPTCGLTEQNLLTQQRKIVREHLVPEDVRRKAEMEAVGYRYYLRTARPKLSDKHRKVFRMLTKSYRRMKELHAINRAIEYIDSVLDLDWACDREIKTLAMKRVVQVICETLRGGRDTPTITRHAESFVNVVTPQRILACAKIRDYLSHYRRGGDLLSLLSNGCTVAEHPQEHLRIRDDSLDYEEVHRNLKILRSLFLCAQNLQHILAIKTLVNRLYDSKSLEEIKSYYAYLFRHNSSDYLQDLEFAPFTLLEIGTLLDAIGDEYLRHGLPANDRLERMRSRLATEIDGYKVLHRQFSSTILMVDCLISKIKSNQSHEKIRHTFRSHLQVFQRSHAIDRQLLVQLRDALLGYFYEDLPEQRRRSSLEQRLALLVVRVLYTIDRQLCRSLTDPREPPVLQLTTSGSALLKRLEEATGVRLPIPADDPIFCKMSDNPTKRYDLLRQLLRRHRVAYGANLLADLQREEERATEEKVAQLQKLFLDQNMNMKTFNRTDEIAFEMLMLEATNALSGKLANNRDSLCNYVPVLTGRNLRNYLAHGHITYEILIPNVSSKTILLNALSVIKLSKNIISEIYERHRWSFADKLALLKHQEAILSGFRYQTCGEIRETIRAEASLLGQSHLNHGIVDHLIQQQSCMLLGHLLDFDRVDEFLKPLAYLMEPVTAIPGGRPLHSVLGDVRARREFCYNLAVLSNDEDILSKIVTDFGYGQIDAIPMVYNFDRLFASFLETHPDYDVNADSNTEILHYAVQSGNVELLNLLLDQCHDLNLRDAFGHTPLDVACKLSNVEMVKALTNAGAKWYTNGEHGCSQYSWIFLNNDQDAIVFLKNNDLLSAKVASACVDLFLQYCDDSNEEIVEFMLANNGVEYGGLYTKAAAFRRLHVLQFLFESDRKAKTNVNRKETTGQGQTPLHVAARRGYADVVELLLRHGANVQERDTNGNSALHFAIECRNVRIVRALLRHGAPVGVRNSLGKSPLEMALESAPGRLTRILLNSGQSVENVILPEQLENRPLVEKLLRLTNRFEYSLSPGDNFGDSFTPLHRAPDERAVQQFLKLYDIDVPSPRYSTTPLHLACLCNELRRVKILLKHGANPTLANSEGLTPLQLAVGNRNTPLVRTLLEHIARRNGEATENLDAVLAIAVRKCALDIANLLLQKGASIETIGRTLAALSPVPRGSKTPQQQQQPPQHQLLFGAAREGYNRILEYLLESDLFDVNSKDTIGSTPLFHALAGAPLETLDILLRHGADVEHRNRFGHNVLSIATMAGRLDVIRYCVNNCPEVVRLVVEAECDTDNTVLHLAVLRGALDIVRYCVELHRANGYGLDAQNKEGFTALHISAQTGSEPIFGHLLTAGADPTITSANGQSILHTAICNRNLAIVRAILGAQVLPVERDLLLDLDQRSPLHYAVFSRNVAVVREILKLPQLPLNHGDARGNTALHLAAEFQAIDIYNLLQKRVDNELRNANGKRAIDILLRK